MELTSKQRAQLRGLANTIGTILQVGKADFQTGTPFFLGITFGQVFGRLLFTSWMLVPDGQPPHKDLPPDSPAPEQGEQLLCVRLRAAEGGDARQGQDRLRLMPAVEGQKHVRPHQQPQLVLRVQGKSKRPKN